MGELHKEDIGLEHLECRRLKSLRRNMPEECVVPGLGLDFSDHLHFSMNFREKASVKMAINILSCHMNRS